jgi:CheY-like chemotaxis protein
MVNKFSSLDPNQKSPFDAIFIDNYMPRMNGAEAIKWIRNHGWDNIIIISMTASSIPAEETALLEAGTNEIVRKPFGIEMIKFVIEKYIPH